METDYVDHRVAGSAIGNALDQQAAQANGCTALGVAASSLRDRAVSRYARAERETQNVLKLRRLADLMSKHPEVVEILELIRDLNL